MMMSVLNMNSHRHFNGKEQKDGDDDDYDEH